MNQSRVYIALDGDGVGTRLGVLIDTEASDKVIANFAGGVAREMETFTQRAESLGCFRILCSGDSVLISCPSGKVSKVLAGLKEVQHCTYSGGVGRTIKEAAVCLQYAKSNGKNQTWHYNQNKPFWLWLRVESFFKGLSKYASGHF